MRKAYYVAIKFGFSSLKCWHKQHNYDSFPVSEIQHLFYLSHAES